MKASVRQCRDYLRSVLTPEEFASLTIEKGGRHFKATLPGRGMSFTIPGTPGDGRWFLNWRASFRQQYEGRPTGRRHWVEKTA